MEDPDELIEICREALVDGPNWNGPGRMAAGMFAPACIRQVVSAIRQYGKAKLRNISVGGQGSKFQVEKNLGLNGRMTRNRICGI